MKSIGGGSVINGAYPSSCRTAPSTSGLLIRTDLAYLGLGLDNSFL